MPATDFDTLENTIHTWAVRCTGLAPTSIQWGMLAQPRPAGPWISMSVMGVKPIGNDWLTAEDNPLTFADLTVDLANPVDDWLAITAHGLQTGDGPVRVEGADIPDGLLADTDYWVVRLDDDTLYLAVSYRATGGFDIGGMPSGNPVSIVDIYNNGGNPLFLVDTPSTRRAGAEIKNVVRGVRTVKISAQCFSGKPPTGAPKSILNDWATACSLPGNLQLLQAGNIGLSGFDNISVAGSALNTTLFEPRATTMIGLNITAEISEIASFIERVSGKNRINSPETDWSVDGAGPPPA